MGATTTFSAGSAVDLGSETGFARQRVTEGRVLEAAQMMGRAWAGNRLAQLRFAEAMAAGDFRNAAFEVLDRETIERYDDLPATWAEFARRTTVRDFKPKRYVDLMGGRSGLDLVPELSEYPARTVSKGLYELLVAKYGGRFAISWEAFVNDELDELRDLPGNLAAAARDTESIVATKLLTDGTGPNDAYFNAGNGNLMAGNPVLTAASLTDALTAISTRRDGENRPIVVTGYVLVVPPALEVAAMNIVNATEIRIEGAVGGNTTVVGNWLRGRVQVVVNPWLTVLDTGPNAAKTWYLLPAPASGRPALVLGFLRGHEQPQIRVKADQGNAISGGATDVTDGSFDIDDIQYRVRHVVGSATMDAKATIVSTGAAA